MAAEVTFVLQQRQSQLYQSYSISMHKQALNFFLCVISSCQFLNCHVGAEKMSPQSNHPSLKRWPWTQHSHYKGLPFSVHTVSKAPSSWGHWWRRCILVSKGLEEALGHSGLCWLVKVEHVGVELSDLACGEPQLWNVFRNGPMIAN